MGGRIRGQALVIGKGEWGLGFVCNGRPIAIAIPISIAMKWGRLKWGQTWFFSLVELNLTALTVMHGWWRGVGLEGEC